MNDPKPGHWDTDVALESALLQRLHRLWLDKCGPGDGPVRLPARRDFDPLEMRDCLGNVFLVEALPDEGDFRYTLIGVEIVRHVEVDNTGKRVSDVFGAAGLALYRKISDERRPIRVTGTVDWHDKSYKGYEVVIMPLADDGVAVNRFIGGMVFTAPAD